MLKVGLTGSIAVGKSYVCDILEENGCAVLDADQTARDVVKRGTPGLAGIVDAFGDSVLTSEGDLDRSALGRIVFRDDTQRQLLNSILHPLIIEAQDSWLREREAEGKASVAVIDAALMIESGSYKRFDKLVVVWCDSDIQLQRLMDRDSIGKEEALRKIGSQMTQEEKKSYANYLIDTSEGFSSTRGNTEKVLGLLLEIDG